ncbi:hypothetical protein D9756_010758 [Leucocoprinus leucothites]|uniref:Uncharacterized protein n=1 Tax=Leucocoprinus leucothites TaxID=201217 RepID=A0A8H5CW28_9AGAR|nr:hypothetical protein D9756_010758 [Leucoagaricus leucothites]
MAAYSSSFPVFPIDHISFAADRAIVSPSDVLLHLKAFGGDVVTTPVLDHVHGPKEVYVHKLRPATGSNLADDSNIQLFKYGIGPLQVSVAYNPESTGIQLQLFLNVPIIGTVQVGNITGSLKDGVSLKIGYGSLLGGEVGAKLDGGSAYLTYSFSALGKQFGGKVKIF